MLPPIELPAARRRFSAIRFELDPRLHVQFRIMKRRLKRLGKVCLFAVCAMAITALAVPLATRGPAEVRPTVSQVVSAVLSESAANVERPLTLNVAHGRKDGRHQALLKRTTIESNLDNIASVLAREQPDVVALQEADGPSLWSGTFDHVEYLALGAGYPHFFRGEHVQATKLSYGTALLSQLPLTDPVSITFAPSPPTFSKGFVVGTVQWPGNPDLEIDIVSVHLDFSRKSVRQKQVRQMINKLSGRKNPLIVMGDFNCGWDGEEESLRTLAKQLDLRAFQPTARNMMTFPALDTRLDWILISPELEFIEYKTISDTLSDHRAVVAVLKETDSK